MGTTERTTAYNKRAMIAAMEKTLGVVTQACKISGVGHRTYYTWLKTDKKFAEEVQRMDDVALDFVESQLFLQIKEGIPSSTIFYLKTKGKNRGYIERTEVSNIESPVFVIKPEQKGVMKILNSIDERNKKSAGT